MAGVGPAQLTPNMWISIIGFYSVCLLAGVTPTAEFFLTSFSHRTQKDTFLYITERMDMKGFYKAFPSKVEPDSSRPYFFYLMGDGLPLDVPLGFVTHPKSNPSLPRSPRHKADAHGFSSYSEGKPPMSVYFYTNPRVLMDTCLFPITDADPGVLEALRVSLCVPHHVPPSLPAAPVVTPTSVSLRYILYFAFNALLPSWVCEILFVQYDRSPTPEGTFLVPNSSPLLNRLLLLF
ncbi:hypothetical protein LIER_12988 [Lithospermum erythrorhizon]|uniref:Uncharacterized protein n=1 Tax=Lithospermum erythrorhizon TaxID=34254 RepID=A0AAV3PWZ7_LITER